ncbi:hypothetical protein ACF1GS_24350 [Streptomyces eurythermus]|uniref:hypothetical protein n=1 Tax=Streptomyces eurythermus TaxID=42237 RepID=UPI00279C589A|nr:hypothetical protein J3S85_24880 [Streptomyces lavenduligriseus]
MHNISGRGVRSVVALLGAGLLVGLTTSCSSPSPTREYAVPSDVCGTHVARSLLEPLLPPGEKVSAQPTSSVGVERCRMLVDGKVVLSTSIEKHDANTSVGDVASSAYGVEPTDTRADGGRTIYSKTGAVSLVECPGSASANSTLWATVRTSHDVKASSMRDFIKGYATALGKSDACRALSTHGHA